MVVMYVLHLLPLYPNHGDNGPWAVYLELVGRVAVSGEHNAT
jgi:hypothetical protein